MKWKWFTFRQYKDALDWAHAGNVAVHETGFSFRQYKVTAHLFTKDTDSLYQAAKKVGCHPGWIQKRGPGHLGFTDHFDLFGRTLEKAMKLCVE